MKVELVGYSQMAYNHGDPMAIAEQAASVCYDSKPTENLKIVKQCIASGHMSVLEHVSFTFHIQGISRACLAQLSRHRHISLSVRSQRYCREDDFQFVNPFPEGSLGAAEFADYMEEARINYVDMVASGVLSEDARSVLPNACCTELYMTANARALIEMSRLRMCSRAQREIRELFNRDLAFGTGGLRGVIGAGTNRMNIYTVAKASQRIMAANRGGWKHGLQQMGLYEHGILAGAVSTVPNWLGFTAEDYNRASLRAHGMDETTLNEIAARIEEKNEVQQTAAPMPEALPTMVEINSDDYEMFPDRDVVEENPQDEREEVKPTESFDMWVRALRERNAVSLQVDKKAVSRNDLSDCEIARAEYFSTRDKVCFTLDRSGIAFNKCAFNRMSMDAEVMQVELAFNAVEQMLIVRKAGQDTPKTLKWVKESHDAYTMKRCGCKGVASAIFNNMGWNTDYKYRVIGRAVECDGETMLVFYLDSSVRIVPAKPYTELDAENVKSDKKKAKKMFLDGFLPYGIVLPNLEDFDLGEGPMAAQAKNMAKSRAIYYDTNTNKKESELTLADLGEERFSPERIRHMLQRGLSPAEGWSYLRGMAVIQKNKFTIYPSEWSEDFGNNIYDNSDTHLRNFMARHRKNGLMEAPTPYGWTVGLDLPTLKTVRETIEMMKQEMVG